MAKINIILDRRYKRKDNTYPLKITIFRDKTIYIPINIYIKEEEWDKVKITQNKVISYLTRCLKKQIKLLISSIIK